MNQREHRETLGGKDLKDKVLLFLCDLCVLSGSGS
jgi:hypothetical protein